MAVNYTTVFTILGDDIATVNQYFAIMGTFNTDQAATEALLDAQNVNRFVDGLEAMYAGFRGDVISWVGALVGRTEIILTDYSLVTSQFEFGSNPGVQEVLATIVADMKLGAQSVKNSVITVGSVTKTTANAAAGAIVITKLMDGVTPPISGAQALPQYANINSLFVPDSETITLTCINDSETGGLRGNEIFDVKGIGPQSDPYSKLGERIGDAGQIQVGDLDTSAGINLGFESWSGSPLAPDNWLLTSGVAGTDFEQGDTATETLNGSGHSLKLHHTGADIEIFQVLNPRSVQRLKSYFISMWVKDVAGTDDSVSSLDVRVLLSHSPGGAPTTIGTSTASHLQTNTNTWSLITAVAVIPAEIVGNLILTVKAIGSATGGDFLVDQVNIIPIQYVAGVGIGVFGGVDKFLVGDTFTFTVSNNNAGLIHTFFRKAFKVQLPVNASPTISDSLVA